MLDRELRRRRVSKGAVFKKVKKATVAMAVFHDGDMDRPYTIIGSVFCIHPRGVIVTCRHVLSVFFSKDFEELIAEIPEEEKRIATTKKRRKHKALCALFRSRLVTRRAVSHTNTG